MSAESKGSDTGGGGEPKGRVPAAICNTSGLQHKPTTADGKKKTQRRQGENIRSWKGKKRPCQHFSPATKALSSTTILHGAGGRGQTREKPRWRGRPRPRQHSAAFADSNRSHFLFHRAPLGGDRVTSRQAREGCEPLGGAPPACMPACLLLSRPLATPHNKLSNATASVSCERRPSQNWRRSPLLRLSARKAKNKVKTQLRFWPPSGPAPGWEHSPNFP